MTQVNTRRPSSPRAAVLRSGTLSRLLAADLFAALADPTRVRLLACLALCARPCTVGEIAECCHVDLSVVSRHLKLLRDAGVLQATRRGRSVQYQVRARWLSDTLRSMADAIDRCGCSPCEESPQGGCCAR